MFQKMYAWGRLWYLSPLREYALSLLERRKLEIWMLLQLYSDLEYNRDFTFFMIPRFAMPNVIKQRYSRLLVMLPIVNNENPDMVYPNIFPNSFYFDTDLQDRQGEYVINILKGLDLNWEAFNDRLDQGYGRFILPLKRWEPTWDIKSGDNLVTLVQNIDFEITQFGR